MKKENLKKLATLIAGLVLLAGAVFATDWVIDGNAVYVNDSNVYLRAEPHTITDSGWVEFTLVSKVFTGDINVVWGFNVTEARPRLAELYHPHTVEWNTSHSMTIYNATYYTTAEPCTIGNEYNSIKRGVDHTLRDWNETGNETIWTPAYDVVCFDSFQDLGDNDYEIYWHTEHSRVENWLDVSDRFSTESYEFGGMNKWFYVRDVSIQQDVEYRLRAYVDVPFQSSGKYWFGLWPATEGIHEAVLNGHFYYLDPWWDSNWDKRKAINLTCSQGTPNPFQVELNVTYDSDMKVDFSDLRFVDDDDSTLLDAWLRQKSNSSWAQIYVEVPANITASGHTIYMYYNNSGASSYWNGTATFLYFEDFESYSPGDCPTGVEAQCYDDAAVQGCSGDRGGQCLRLPSSDGTYDRWEDNFTVGGATLYSNGSLGMWRYMSAESVNNGNVILCEDADSDLCGDLWFVDGWRGGDIMYVNTASSWADTTYDYTSGDWHYLDFPWNNSNWLDEIYDGTATGADKRNDNNYNVKSFRFQADANPSPAYNAEYDDLFLRYYQDPEPSASYGSEESAPAGNTAPTVSANATSPATVYTDTDVQFNVTCYDPDTGDTIFSYGQPLLDSGGGYAYDESEWNVTVSNNTNTLVYTYGSGNFSRGDKIKFEFWCGDGTANSTKYNSSAITVQNSVPTIIAVDLWPDAPATANDLYVNATAEDADNGDTITVYCNISNSSGVQYAEQSSVVTNNTNTLIFTLGSTNTSSGEVWNATCWASDATANSSYLNDTVTIQNTVPGIGMNATSPAVIYNLTDVEFNMSCYDPDKADTLTAYIQPWLDTGGGFTTDESEASYSGLVNNTNTLVYTYDHENFSKGDQILFEFWCGDGTVNSSKHNSTILTVQNSVPSTPTNLSPANNTWTADNTTTLDWDDSTDDDNDTVYYWLVVDNNSDFSSPEHTDADFQGSTNTTAALSDGTYYWRVIAGDHTGNSSWSEAKYYNLDVTPPVINIIYPTNTTYNEGTNVVLNFSYTEVNTDTCWYSLNAGANTTIGYVNNTALTSTSGSHHVELFCNDSANNVAKDEEWFVINTVPNATANATSPANVYNLTDVFFNVTCIDGESWDTIFSYGRVYLDSGAGFSVDGAEWNQTVSNNTNTQVYIYEHGNFTKGDQIIFEFWCGDVHENSTKFNSSTISVLNSAPTAPVWSFPANLSFINTNYTLLNFSSTDNDNDTITYYVWADNTTSPTTLAYNGTAVYFNYTNLNETTYYAVGIADDGTVNSSNSSTLQFTIDLTNPTITINQPANNSVWSTSWIWANLTASEALSWAGASINATANQTMSNDTLTHYYLNVSVGEGENNNITFCFNDTAGNMNCNNTLTLFDVDLTAPAYSAEWREAEPPQEVGIWLYFNVTWTDLNFDSVWIDWNGTNTSVTTYLSGGGNSRIYYKRIEGTQVGTINYSWYCNDTAGNENHTTYNSYEYRLTSPTGSPSGGGSSASDPDPYEYEEVINATAIKIAGDVEEEAVNILDVVGSYIKDYFDTWDELFRSENKTAALSGKSGFVAVNVLFLFAFIIVLYIISLVIEAIGGKKK